jgi:hypothetical protein
MQLGSRNSVFGPGIDAFRLHRIPRPLTRCCPFVHLCKPTACPFLCRSNGLSNTVGVVYRHQRHGQVQALFGW